MIKNNQKISAIDGGEVSAARLEALTDAIFGWVYYFGLSKKIPPGLREGFL